MFTQDRPWLERQPGMNPWEQGCATLEMQLGEWTTEYSAQLCDQAVTAEGPNYQAYKGRLWGSWGYHWHQAADLSPDGTIPGDEVAERIQSGRGYYRGGRLGGDPLRDVILAMAVRLHENRATEQFHADYFEYLRLLAGKRRQAHYRDPGPWWSEFLDFLAGYTRPSGKLDRFLGRCGLQNWLGTVLWKFLRRWERTQMDKNQPWPEEEIAGGLSTVNPEIRPCVELLSELIGEALGRLTKSDRLVLYLLFVDRLTLKQAAAILGKRPGNQGAKHPGTVLRQRDRALKRLRETLAEVAEARGQEGAYAECLESLDLAPREFADALFQALSESCEDEDQSGEEGEEPEQEPGDEEDRS